MPNMKLVTISVLVPAALAFSACASDGYYEGGYGYGGYGPSYSGTAFNHSGWYDNHYGPIYDGYWGPRDVFYYRTAPDGVYVIDRDRHFRRDHFHGGVEFRYRDHDRRGRDSRGRGRGRH